MNQGILHTTTVFDHYNNNPRSNPKYKFGREQVFAELLHWEDMVSKLNTFLSPENIVQIDLVDYLGNKRYRNEQPEVCVDCRRKDGECLCLKSVGWRVAQHANMTAGLVRACGKYNIGDGSMSRIDEFREYGDLIREYSLEYYAMMWWGYCHDGDAPWYADKNKTNQYQGIDHIKCGGIQLVLDMTKNIAEWELSPFKTNKYDVKLLQKLVQWSYENRKLEVLQWWYSPDGFLLFTNPITIGPNGEKFVKTVKNNTFWWVSFFTADKAWTDAIMENEIRLFIQFLNSKDNPTLHRYLVKICVLHGYLWGNIRDNYFQICMEKVNKQVRRHFMTVAQNLWPVQDLSKTHSNESPKFIKVHL